MVVKFVPAQEDETLDQKLLFPDDDEHPIFTKDELNLAEFPFCLPALHHPKNRNEIRVVVEGFDPAKKPIRKEWMVTGSEKYGLPLAIDEEVLLGLMFFLHKEGFRSQRLRFTQYQLFKFLGWATTSSRSYERLHQCLCRLTGATIFSHEIFWDHEAKAPASSEQGFHVIEKFELYHREKAPPVFQELPWEATMTWDPPSPHFKPSEPKPPFCSEVIFSDTIFKNIQSGFIKTLDFSFFQSLKLPLSRRLFRILDKKKYHGLRIEIDLMHLAQLLAMTRRLHPSRVKTSLEKPHQELTRRRYIGSIRYRKTAHSEFVIYHLAQTTAAELAKTTLERPLASKSTERKEAPLVAELVTRGVTRSRAVVLVDTVPESRICDQIEAFDYRVKHKSPEVARNPPGFLCRAIEQDFTPPPDFVSKVERERKRQAREAAERRQIDEKTAAQLAEQEALDHFERLYAGLPDADRGAIMDEATARLNEYARRSFNQERAEGRNDGPGHWVLRDHRNAILAGRNAGGATISGQNGGLT